MTQNIDEAELSVGPKAIDAYSRLSYTMWFALAEFVDNSTQSRLNYGTLVDELLKSEGQPLTVSIVHNRQTKEIMIEDNSIGMTKADLIAALKIANPTADSKGRSKYGMGMKTAACWIGAKWSVTTCEWAAAKNGPRRSMSTRLRITVRRSADHEVSEQGCALHAHHDHRPTPRDSEALRRDHQDLSGFDVHV
ncbi:ATP-binding protein [Luteimonas fraxinea]|uniref:ATP-binding protein n=1 Tax=Luteimonas fraxinea TaxID=2901869 RepID=UPI001E3E95AA|nr:ATP-binding protein [Luteimonas fraxinea]UHH10169.1 ATP-binding protein [Luteimonas fraxinea]